MSPLRSSTLAVAASVRAEQALAGEGIGAAAARPAEQVLLGLDTAPDGLSPAQAELRLARYGPNAVSSHRARLVLVLWHQLRSPLLALLLVAATASYFVGERSGAVIIGCIVALSMGLGFVNEYRAEQAAETLHSQINHQSVAVRGGEPTEVDVTDLVPGDIVDLRLGDIVPADLRLLSVSGLECRCSTSPPSPSCSS